MFPFLARHEWGARAPARPYRIVQTRPGVETHHSVGLYGTDDLAEWARRVQADHLGRSWTDVFYNWGIWTDGTVVELRPSHAASGPIDHLTVCLAGNYDTRPLAEAQARSWHAIRDHLLTAQSPSATDIAWHGQRARVGCPGASVIAWLRDGAPRPANPQQQEDDVNLFRDGKGRVWEVVLGQRWHIPSGAMFDALGHDWSRVKDAPDDHPVWTLPVVKAKHTHSEYVVKGTEITTTGTVG